VSASVEAAQEERAALQAEASTLARRLGDLDEALARKVRGVCLRVCVCACVCEREREEGGVVWKGARGGRA
jgi:hypothetical protein